MCEYKSLKEVVIMNKNILSLLTLIIVAVTSISGCLNENEDDEKEYFSETYHKIYFEFEFEHQVTNGSSYAIIPAPVQNGKILNFSDFQNYDGFDNFSYEFVDTEHGKGLKISPAPPDKFWIWFDCDPYTTQAPFSIKQTDQFYRSDYPGLSTWETDGTSAYYWFYCSVNTSTISYKYEYSDCYAFKDMGGNDNLGSSGWFRIKNMRIQEDMPM
jgi:hypothetical protein